MKNLYIIDAYNLIYRMFYAIPEMHTRDGKIVNAVFGVAKFIKSLTDMSPDDTIIVASESGSNFRETLYADYKWTRDRMPDNLRSQIDAVFEFFQVAGIPVLVREGYEADDIIGSITHDPDGYNEVIIISSDKDLCQFVKDGRVRIFDAMKQKNMRRADVIEKFGVPPEQVKDYLAIVWDSSDNIPGISWFGPKKAVELLEKYHTLEGIYKELWIEHYELGTEVKFDQEKYNSADLTEKTKQVLIDQINNAFLSEKLASIVTDLSITIEDVKWVDSREIFSNLSVIEFLKKYEFKSLIPAEHREAKKEVKKWTSIQVRDLTQLSLLEDEIRKSEKIFLTTDTEWRVAIGVADELYIINTLEVDALDFFDRIFESDIKINGYDLKEDIKRIQRQKKSLVWIEGQGKLF